MEDYSDTSDLNPGKKIFMSTALNDSVVHRGLNIVSGYLFVKPKPRKRIIEMQINLLANKMRARKVNIRIDLRQLFPYIQKIEEEYLY